MCLHTCTHTQIFIYTIYIKHLNYLFNESTVILPMCHMDMPDFISIQNLQGKQSYIQSFQYLMALFSLQTLLYSKISYIYVESQKKFYHSFKSLVEKQQNVIKRNDNHTTYHNAIRVGQRDVGDKNQTFIFMDNM